MFNFPSLRTHLSGTNDNGDLGKKLGNASTERTIASGLGALFESSELVDVNLICPSTANGKRSIAAHRAILAARSTFFLQLFKDVLQKVTTTRNNTPPVRLQQGAQTTKRKSSLSIPITSPSPARIGSTPFITHSDLLELPPEVYRSPDVEDEHSWPLSGSDEDLTDVPLSQHSRSSDTTPTNPSPYYASFMGPKSQSTPTLSASRRLTANMSVPTPPARFVNGILEIELASVRYEALLPIIRYLYMLNMELTTQNLVDTFALANEMCLYPICGEILSAISELVSEEDVLDLLVEAHSTQNCESLSEAILKWLSADISRPNALLQSPQLYRLPMDLVFRMMAMGLFSDEMELYERFSEMGGGEVSQILENMNFGRMNAEQLLRLHKTGKVKDSIILEAFSSRLREGKVPFRDSTGSSILVEVSIFGDVPSPHSAESRAMAADTSSGAVEYIHGVPMGGSHSRSSISGTSPASLIRRRSVAVTVPSEIGELVQSIGSETWASEPFQVHYGNWTAIVKTRNGMLYKAGLTLNHTTTECDRIGLDSPWSIQLEVPTASPHAHIVSFSPSSFTMGKECYKHIDSSVSTALGFQMLGFKKPAKKLLQMRIQFPMPSNISHHIME